MRPARTLPVSAVPALLLALLLPAAPALAADPIPAYPSATSVPEDTEGTIILPGLATDTGQFQFALKDSAAPLVDTRQVVDAATELLEGTGLKLAVAVDQDPSSVASAAQLIRGMLLFGPIDALSDDWLEHGKTRGYVGKDWVVIGIILPESGKGPARVAVDLGRNVKSNADRGDLDAAGLRDYSGGNTTDGVIATIESVVSGVKLSPDYAKYALLVLGVLVALASAAGITKGLRHRRRAWEQNRQEQTLAAVGRIGTLAREIELLGYRPMEVIGSSPAANAVRWLGEHGPGLVQAARLATGPEGNTDFSNSMRQKVIEYAAALEELSSILQELASWDRPSRRTASFRTLQEHHRTQLSGIPQLLETRRSIVNAGVLRQLAVEHTDALETLETEIPATSGVSHEDLLAAHWQLRRELEVELDRALEAGRGTAELAGTLRRGPLEDPDIYERLSGLIGTYAPVLNP